MLPRGRDLYKGMRASVDLKQLTYGQDGAIVTQEYYKFPMIETLRTVLLPGAGAVLEKVAGLVDTLME